jgi:hypothetical protein
MPGLRRSSPIAGAFDFTAGLPRQSSLAVPVAVPDSPPVEVVGGEVASGSSLPGARRVSAIAASYHDTAHGLTRAGQAPQTSAVPFKLDR